ncbi:glycosyltransferase family 4 protein [Vibrio lentus]|uniref:glycosyltransferase family 4 protein n=1 Tax=Vibrio lentus TaxID=136468 RepID=UPI0024791FBF|nr:glycosyltransferase family 4 protein [Vibrio lentus]WGS60770.1 glycosyltransferase family 4 protein [Vibrio lentus]
MSIRINIVGTDPYSGRGGISSSSRNLEALLRKYGYSVRCIVSHRANSKLMTLLRAAYELIGTKGENDIFWIQLGPWVSILRKIVLMIIIRSKKGKVYLQIHSKSFDDYTHSFFGRALQRVCLGLADKVIVLGPWWNNFVLDNYTVDESKLSVIPNFLSDADFNHSKRKITDGNIKIVAMSRLVEGKGFEQVIDMIANAEARFTLDIIGAGPIECELKEMVSIKGLDKQVVFHGWKNGKEKELLLLNSDIFVLPSSNDSFGMVYIEAMSLGVPVIALRFKGVTDVVPHKKGGYLVDSSDINELLNAVSFICSDYSNQSSLARSHFSNNFSESSVIQQLSSIIGN